jgi:hypothetical protein
MNPVHADRLQGFPLDIMKRVHGEMLRTARDRDFPVNDPVRMAGLLCEEAGEVMAEALELTRARSNHSQIEVAIYLSNLCNESIHAASVAIKIALVAEETLKQHNIGGGGHIETGT